MNYFVALVLGGTLVSVAVGALLGLFRGMRRSILRAALLVLCFVLALALCGSVSNAIVNIKISDGKTIEELLASSFSEGGKAVTDIVIPMAQAFAKVICVCCDFRTVAVCHMDSGVPDSQTGSAPADWQKSARTSAWLGARRGLRSVCCVCGLCSD